MSNRGSRPEVFYKEAVLRNFAKFTGKYLRQSLLIKLQASGLPFLIKLQASGTETLAQVFSCKFCEISKNTFSYRTPPVITSGVISFI